MEELGMWMYLKDEGLLLVKYIPDNDCWDKSEINNMGKKQS